MTLLATYRPPDTSLTHFLDEIDLSIRNLKQKSMIIGDMNIDISKSNNYVSQYLDLMALNGFINCNPIINTRVDPHRNTKTNIDHMFIRNITDEVNSGVIQTNISDHYALFVNISNENMEHDTNICKKRILNGKKSI